MVKKAAAHLGMVIKGTLFIGFTVQILLGLGWMCANFLSRQDFPEPESVLYRQLAGLAGGLPQVLYLVQLGTAFWAVSFFLNSLLGEAEKGDFPGRCRRIWEILAVLTYPFAMQCHMAVLSFSLLGSLLTVAFALLLRILSRGNAVGRGNCHRGAARPSVFGGTAADTGIRRRWFSGETAADTDSPRFPLSGEKMSGKGRKYRTAKLLGGIFLCAALWTALSGTLDREAREKPGRSLEAAMASRFAWFTMWNDQGMWDQELQETVRDVLWESGYCPGNMEILERVMEESLDPETARKYYMQMAQTGWRVHGSIVIRQIGWDMLGYLVTPAVFQKQLQGEAYDSYTGRNYEAMGGHCPALTKDYVDYGCWWFAASLFLALALAIIRVLGREGAGLGRRVFSWAVCMGVMGILALALTMRGAGIMDYKYTVAAGGLWQAFALLFMEGTGREGDEGH